MSTLTNKKISDTYKGLLKTADETTLSETPKAITDGDGNNSGVLLDNLGNLKVNNVVEFGSLKDADEDITIEKFVDEADGIENNDNDTSLPTSAAVKNYVDQTITAEDLDFSGNSGTGDVDLDSEVFEITGSNGITTTALDNTLDIDGSTLQTAINTNAADISTNSADISTNSSDIATNASNISTNATNIASNDTDIATNAANIATNVTNISTNQSNISTNATNIATNTTDIASNAADIASNDTDISNLQTSVSTNTTDIASNAADISTNSTAISTNASGISTNAAAISTNATDIATNSSNITTNAANIATNTTNIATNTTDIATNVTDIATNANNIASNDTDIATNASNISSNATNIATNAANITSNDTDIATNAANIATNTSNISTNEADIIANGNDIATNSSNISTNTSNISTNTSNISTNTSNISTNTSNISTNTSNITTNTNNISTNTTDIADLQTDVGNKVSKSGDTMTGALTNSTAGDAIIVSASNGKVAIRKTSATAALDVNGSTKISNALTVGGTAKNLFVPATDKYVQMKKYGLGQAPDISAQTTQTSRYPIYTLAVGNTGILLEDWQYQTWRIEPNFFEANVGGTGYKTIDILTVTSTGSNFDYLILDSVELIILHEDNSDKGGFGGPDDEPLFFLRTDQGNEQRLWTFTLGDYRDNEGTYVTRPPINYDFRSTTQGTTFREGKDIVFGARRLNKPNPTTGATFPQQAFYLTIKYKRKRKGQMINGPYISLS